MMIMQKSNRNEHNLLKMLYLCTRLEVARKGRRVNILVVKRTFTNVIFYRQISQI